MKKVFFATVFAVVAVGAAFATNSKKTAIPGELFTENAEDADIHCTAGELLCSAFYSEDAYDKKASDPTRVIVNLMDYEHN